MKIKYIIYFNQRTKLNKVKLFVLNWIKLFKLNPEIKRRRIEVKLAHPINLNRRTYSN